MMPLPAFCDVEPFRVELVPGGDVVRARPVGELDLMTAHELDARLRELVAAGSRRVILDLSRLTFVDSSGLRLIVEFSAFADRDGIELELLRGPRPVQRAFEVSGLFDRLPFRPV